MKAKNIWKKRDGTLISLPTEACSLSYKGKEISDETILAEIAMPGQPVTLAVQRVSLTVRSYLNNRDYKWFFQTCTSDRLSALKGQVYGYSGISPECQDCSYEQESHMEFDSTTCINASSNDRKRIKACGIYPGDKLRLTAK